MPIVRRLTKVGNNERGATAVIVGIMLIVLFGAAALAFDVGLMYEERRELQRTADVAAVSGAMNLKESTDAAFDTAAYFVNENPTVHHPDYDPVNGDTITASNSCIIDGFSFLMPCVRVNVVTPEFPLTFAAVLGNNDTRISAQATAVYASASPNGLRLVPWVIIDCPDTQGLSKINGTYLYPDEVGIRGTSKISPDAAAPYGWRIDPSGGTPVMDEPYGSACGNDGYTFSDSWEEGTTPGNSLFFSSGPTGGNFQGGNLQVDPDCPAAGPDVYFGHGGGADDYTGFLSREKSACTVARGARIDTKPGAMREPTYSAIDDRLDEWAAAHGGVSCMNKTTFDLSVQRTPKVGDGPEMMIKPYGEDNPCLMALIYVVHSEERNPNVTSETHHGNSIEAVQDMMAPLDERFRSLSHGASSHMVVRRFSLFYLTSNPDPHTKKPWTGLFMKSDDAIGSEVADMPCIQTDGICRVQQVYEGY